MSYFMSYFKKSENIIDIDSVHFSNNSSNNLVTSLGQNEFQHHQEKRK